MDYDDDSENAVLVPPNPEEVVVVPTTNVFNVKDQVQVLPYGFKGTVVGKAEYLSTATLYLVKYHHDSLGQVSAWLESKDLTF